MPYNIPSSNAASQSVRLLQRASGSSATVGGRSTSEVRPASAGQDTVGLSDEALRHTDLRALGVAMRDVAEVTGTAQSADGALNKLTDLLSRIGELGQQVRTGAVSTVASEDYTSQIEQLRAQIDDAVRRTTYKYRTLLPPEQLEPPKEEVRMAGGEPRPAAPSTASESADKPAVEARRQAEQAVRGREDRDAEVYGEVTRRLKELGPKSSESDFQEFFDVMSSASSQAYRERASLGAMVSALNSRSVVLERNYEAAMEALTQSGDRDRARELEALARGAVTTNANTAIVTQANISATRAVNLLGV